MKHTLLDLFRNYIRLLKLSSSVVFLLNFSIICMHILSKFTKEFIQKWLIFSDKAHYARNLFFILIFFCTLSAKENTTKDISKLDITLTADCEPLTSIAGCVNVESGRFFQVENDIVGNTIDPLSLRRFYDSNSFIASKYLFHVYQE